MGQTHCFVYKIEPIKRIQLLPDDNEDMNGELINKEQLSTKTSRHFLFINVFLDPI